MTAALAVHPPASTPGDQRENTSMLVGATMAGIMTAAQVSLLALLGTAVGRVAAGAGRAAQARQLHAAASVVIHETQQRAGRLLDHTHGQVMADVRDAFATALPARRTRTLFGVPVDDPGLSGPATQRFPDLELPTDGPVAPSWTRLAGTLTDALHNAQMDVEEVFQDTAVSVGSGEQAGIRAAQVHLDELSARGLTVFTDRAHRRWELPAYAEMSSRTACTRLALGGQMGLMSAHGLDLAIVDVPRGVAGCRKCEPYEGRVLSLSGVSYPGMAVSVTLAGGRMVTAFVFASLTSAIAEGLFHPNCRHSLLPYADGAAVLPQAASSPAFNLTPWYRGVPAPEDSAAYRHEQVQRALERSVRRGIQRRAVALTPQARTTANRRITTARNALNRHVASYHRSQHYNPRKV